MSVKQDVKAIGFGALIEHRGPLRVSNRTRFPYQFVLLVGRKPGEHRKVRDQ
jgi:hypothetical protein